MDLFLVKSTLLIHKLHLNRIVNLLNMKANFTMHSSLLNPILIANTPFMLILRLTEMIG